MQGSYMGSVNKGIAQADQARGAIMDAELGSREEWYLKGYRRGQVITCDRGLIWFTQQGDIKDYILGPGESLTISTTGPAAVRALKAAKVSIYSGQRKSSLWARMRRAFMPKTGCGPVCHQA